MFDGDGLTKGGAITLAGAGVAAWLAAPVFGAQANAVRIAGIAGIGIGIWSLAARVKAEGGIAASAAGLLLPETPTTAVVERQVNVEPTPVVNPGGGATNDFLRLSGGILSPTNGETLHARKQLTLDGTYPVELFLRNDRPTSSRGYVRLVTVETTLFGPDSTGGVNGDPQTLEANSYSRLVMNVPAASGRASLGISVTLWASWVETATARERDLGRVVFLLM